MIKIALTFLFLWGILAAGISTFLSLTGKDKLKVVKLVAWSGLFAIIAGFLQSATAVVTRENELKAKEKEVAIAEAESRRMQALAANSEKSIAMMDAQARLAIAQGVREGKVHTIVIPADFKGMVNVK